LPSTLLFDWLSIAISCEQVVRPSSLEQGWGLAQAWYSDRLEPSWHPKTAAEAKAAFAALGLTSPFWKMT